MIQGRRVCPNNGFVLSLLIFFLTTWKREGADTKDKFKLKWKCCLIMAKYFFQSVPVMSFFPVVVVVVCFFFLHFGMIKLIFIKCPFL